MVYREIAAHLRQVEGVETGLYPSQAEQFDYNQSQVGGLWIQYSQTAGKKVGEWLRFWLTIRIVTVPTRQEFLG